MVLMGERSGLDCGALLKRDGDRSHPDILCPRTAFGRCRRIMACAYKACSLTQRALLNLRGWLSWDSVSGGSGGHVLRKAPRLALAHGDQYGSLYRSLVSPEARLASRAQYDVRPASAECSEP